MSREYTDDKLLAGSEDLGIGKLSPFFKNIGWSLGNYCPMECDQCYSRSIREQGLELTPQLIDRIVGQLSNLGVETVNLGGNEPIYTNGPNTKASLLPYVVDSLISKGIKLGVTTAGPTLIKMEKHFPEFVTQINDVDISIDSPRSVEHNKNRGNREMFDIAICAMEICKEKNIPRSFVMCGMNWNFTPDRLQELISLARQFGANVRINPMKPTEPRHMRLVLEPREFYRGLAVLMDQCDPVNISDSLWASAIGISSAEISGCSCGTNSFRIHAINPKGEIPVSPCVYLHDYKCGDLTVMDIADIVNLPSFRMFRERKYNPQSVDGCTDCENIQVCGGGCAARSYLHTFFESNGQVKNLFARDPYCFKEMEPKSSNLPQGTSIVRSGPRLVHEGYLCTAIFSPKN